MEYGNEKWEIKKPKEDPVIQVLTQTCEQSYFKNSLDFPRLNVVKVPVIAETGARTTVAGKFLLRRLGLKEDYLFAVELRLCGANNTNLRLLGGLLLNLKYISPDGVTRESKNLCYIQEDNPEKFYLGRTACEDLGIISENFPHQTFCATNGTLSNKETECSCPKRSVPPPVPAKLPFTACEANREKLEQWLMEYYASSTFNTCEHQSLPMMHGPPLHIIVDPNVEPHVVHTPINISY